MKLTTKEIMEIIPHRHPFLLIDTIEELVPGVKATGKKCVTYNEPHFAGHFPQEPVMPGVLIIEALAQTGAVAILSKPENKGKIIVVLLPDSGDRYLSTALFIFCIDQQCKIQEQGSSRRYPYSRSRDH